MVQDVLPLRVFRGISRNLDGRASGRIRLIISCVGCRLLTLPQHVSVHPWLLSYYVEHTILECLFVFGEEVLLPRVVANRRIQVMPLHALFEKAKTILVVRLLLELQTATVDHVVVEFLRHALAQVLQPRLQLLILNILILFVFVAAGQALPRQAAFHEVEHDVSNRFQVITSTLLLAFMGVERGVASRARQILPIAIRNMLAVRGFVILC